MLLSYKKYSFFLFGIVVLADLLLVLYGAENSRCFTKPLLMPVLLIALMAHSTPSSDQKLFIAALLFSLAGDIFLLSDGNPLYFIAGLACFLITHITYIWYFLKQKKQSTTLLKQKPIIPALIVGYTFALLFFLIPKLGDLLVPVIAYALIICIMLLCSIHRYNVARPLAGKLFIAGAFFFVLSDSLLAINRFHTSFTGAGLLIMLTYCIAQFLLVKGFIANQSK